MIITLQFVDSSRRDKYIFEEINKILTNAENYEEGDKKNSPEIIKPKRTPLITVINQSLQYYPMCIKWTSAKILAGSIWTRQYSLYQTEKITNREEDFLLIDVSQLPTQWMNQNPNICQGGHFTLSEFASI